MIEGRRFYLMLKPDPLTAFLIDDVRRALGVVTRYPRGRFHCTLAPLGDRGLVSDGLVERTCAALTFFAAEPFTLTLDWFDGWALRGSSARDACAFQRALVRRLERAGVELTDYTFRPHVSLAFGVPPLGARAIAPIRWRVSGFVLIESIDGKGHRERGRWHLETRQHQFVVG